MNAKALLAFAERVPGARQLLEHRYDQRFLNNRHEQLYRGVFPTFEAAAESMPVPRLGYDNELAAYLYDELVEEVQPYDYPVLFWLSAILNAQPLATVFDFGGHIGVKFYAWRNHLNEAERMPPWTVCDVPAVCARGRIFAAAEGVGGPNAALPLLGFVESFDSVSDESILLCSGSLQYIPDDLWQLLANVEDKERPEHVLLNITPFAAGAGSQYFTLNSFGASFAPYKIQDRLLFIREMVALGYELVDQWENPGRACSIPFQDERPDFQYLGMYFRRAVEE